MSIFESMEQLISFIIRPPRYHPNHLQSSIFSVFLVKIVDGFWLMIRLLAEKTWESNIIKEIFDFGHLGLGL